MPAEGSRANTLTAHLALNRCRVLDHTLEPLQLLDFCLLLGAACFDLV
jgi:hypothetical protein